ncbi:MAG: helix-turn-helix domain-containing protein [Vulcanimicrobiota bacterium]
MIKNDRQLKRSEKKLSELKSLLNDVQSRYSGKALLLYSAGPETMIQQIEREIQEYRFLKEKDLYDVIEEIGDVSLEDIGPVIAKLRIAAGLSQKELAQLLHTKQSNISRLENGRYYSHSLPQLANTGRVLGIDFTICPKPRKEEKPTSSYQ